MGLFQVKEEQELDTEAKGPEGILHVHYTILQSYKVNTEQKLQEKRTQLE